LPWQQNLGQNGL